MQYAEDAANALTAALLDVVGLVDTTPPAELGPAILERCRRALAATQSRPLAPEAPDQSASGEIQFL